MTEIIRTIDTLNTAHDEIERLRAERKQLRALLDECYSTLAAMSMSTSATIPDGLASRIREVLK